MGVIHLAATEKGLAIITLPGETEKDFLNYLKKTHPDYTIISKPQILKDAQKQIEKYLSGQLTKFDLKLDISGTDFQKKVLKVVKAIPYGKTKTYGEIAKSVNSPKAFRAVGSVNAKNRLPLVIPCHRVVASNGLGGYAGGLPMKIKLLEMENNIQHNKR
jgi:O-6-methylguanine DNA methyltransferase